MILWEREVSFVRTVYIKEVGMSKICRTSRRRTTAASHRIVTSCAAAVSAQSVLDSGWWAVIWAAAMSINSGLKNPRDGNAADYDAAVGWIMSRTNPSFCEGGMGGQERWNMAASCPLLGRRDALRRWCQMSLPRPCPTSVLASKHASWPTSSAAGQVPPTPYTYPAVRVHTEHIFFFSHWPRYSYSSPREPPLSV